MVHYFPKKAKLAMIPGGMGTSVPIAAIRSDKDYRLTELLSARLAPIMERLQACPQTFGDWFEIQRGVQPYSREKHSEEQIAKRFLHATKPLGKAYLPELQGKELSRYFIETNRSSYLKFGDDIASSRPSKMFEGQRIVLRRLLTRKFRIQASMTDVTMITTDNVLNVVPCCANADVAFSLGLLNSRFISWLYVNGSAIAQKDDFPQVFIAALKRLPIPSCGKDCRDQVVNLVEAMLKLHKDLAAAKTPNEKETIQRQIAATDEQIDQLVYELYGLTDEEIAIVEEATQRKG
jgi:hypothetical protein